MVFGTVIGAMSWGWSVVKDVPSDSLRLLTTYPQTFSFIGVVFALIAIIVGRRLVKKLEQPPPSMNRLPSPLMHAQSMDSFGFAGNDASTPRRAYGDELLQDRRLRHRYRKLKQNWLQHGQELFSKIRRKKGPQDRWSRRLEDGLESIYSPMELPLPAAAPWARGSSSDLTLDGVQLGGGDVYMAFMAIMNSWKVFGGRDVPLLLKMCTGVTPLELKAGAYLFEEGKPLERCIYILKEGELEISVRADIPNAHLLASNVLPPDFLERINQPGVIVSGILDFVALLTESEVAEYCASARCTKDCLVLQVPIASATVANENDGGAQAQARCRLIRSCLIRSHRVTLSTAYAYLGVIYDLFPRHPIFPVVGSALTSLTPEAAIGEKHQHALKRLIRLVLALDQDYAIPDLESCLVAPSPRAASAYGRSPSPAFGVHTASFRDNNGNGNGSGSGSGNGNGNQKTHTQPPLGRSSLSPALFSLRSTTSAAAAAPWNQPRLYLLRKGESPHELDDQSRTSLHILITGRLQVTKVDPDTSTTGPVPSPSKASLGKSIFSDHHHHSFTSFPATPDAPSPSPSTHTHTHTQTPTSSSSSTPRVGLTPAAARGEHGPGAVLGYSCLLTGAPEDWYTPRGKRRALLRLEAMSDCWVVQIPHVFVERAIKPHPLATLALAARKILETIPRVLRVIDFGIKWKQLQAGEVLVTEGQPSDGCLYVLLYGRARSSIQQEVAGENMSRIKKQVVVVADHGRGTLIGETEILTGGTHKVTVQAVRYTSFATIPSSVLSLLIRRHPRVLAHLAEHVVQKATHNSRHLSYYRDRTPMRMFSTGGSSPTASLSSAAAAAAATATSTSTTSSSSPPPPSSSFWASSSTPAPRRAVIGEPGAKTILVLPVSVSVPLDLFCKTLEAAMSKGKHSVRTVTSALAASVLGLDEEAAYSADWCLDNVLLLESWLTQQEEQHEILLYQADWEDSEWNRMAAGMADVVLLVANAGDGPQITFLEQQMDPFIHNAQKLLILLHVNPSPYYTPSGTRLWIEKRQGINQHYHVRVHTHSAQFDQQHIRSDFSRLSRILTGTAVGLVLGGGGARGMAHLGLLRVLEEEGIPIDHIVGVSVGAFIGGLYAKHSSYLEILPYASRFAQNMSNTWLFLKDFTFLPFTSWFNGYSFGREMEKAFGDTKIEDCWLSFSCITVDLSVSQERIHQNGTLWRYVRGSMTLAGMLPPLCDVDPKDDAVHYLVDGGYVNNLPADVMKEVFSAETILACDIGVDVKMTGRQDYGDTLTGLQILLNAILPWSKTLRAPSMGEISSQLMYVRSVQQLERAKETIDCYLRPPVTHFGIMEWKRHAEVQSLGYIYCRDSVRAWREALKKEKGGGGGAGAAFRGGAGGGVSNSDLVRGRSLSALDDYNS